jgi:hypothetical protein
MFDVPAFNVLSDPVFDYFFSLVMTFGLVGWFLGLIAEIFKRS